MMVEDFLIIILGLALFFAYLRVLWLEQDLSELDKEMKETCRLMRKHEALHSHRDTYKTWG